MYYRKKTMPKKKSDLQKQVEEIYNRHDFDNPKPYYKEIREKLGHFRAVSWDHHDGGEMTDLINALKELTPVADDPVYEGTDTYGILIFNEKFNEPKDVKSWE
jgi:hypothetical protein